MERGFVKIDRKLLEWEWFDDANAVKLLLYCILKANIEDKKWKGMVVPRGSFVTSLSKLSEGTGLSIRAVRTNIQRLKECGTISTQTPTRKYTLVTVEKYGFYQDSPKKTTQETTNQRQTNDKPTTTTKEYKNIRNKEYISSSSYIYNIPTISDVRNYIEENNLNVNADKFYNYYSQREWIVNKKRINWQLRLLDWSKTEKNNNQTMFSSQRNYTHEQLEKMTMLKLAK